MVKSWKGGSREEHVISSCERILSLGRRSDQVAVVKFEESYGNKERLMRAKRKESQNSQGS